MNNLTVSRGCVTMHVWSLQCKPLPRVRACFHMYAYMHALIILNSSWTLLYTQFIVTCMPFVSATLDFLYVLAPYGAVHFNND